MHRLLRQRVYCGDYDYNGVTYAGKYEPDHHQGTVAGGSRRAGRSPHQASKETYPRFSYSELITCLSMYIASIRSWRRRCSRRSLTTVDGRIDAEFFDRKAG